MKGRKKRVFQGCKRLNGVFRLKRKTEKIKKRREKGKWKKGEEETGFSKDAMAKIGGKGRRQELAGNCISQGSLENGVVRSMLRPLQCYVFNKQKSIRRSYVIIRKNERICKMFLSEEL